MNKIFIIILVFSSVILSQENNHLTNNALFSPPNIKLFADYLFCQKDYLRAANEYEHYLSFIPNDTIRFKIAISYSSINNFAEAASRFSLIGKSSLFYNDAQALFLKSIFQEGELQQFRTQYILIHNADTDSAGLNSLYMFSYLFTHDPLPSKGVFLNAFPSSEKNKIETFYEWNNNPHEKSPLKAAIYSAIIPGAGKIYADETPDGIWAFIATVGTGYLAYDNFKAGHKFRGWIFSALSAGFYAGNIYGSAAAVQIYNAQIRFDFVNELNSFLENKNYFLKVFRFCN
jgi:TM2 domain-containing membrane protein YozV